MYINGFPSIILIVKVSLFIKLFSIYSTSRPASFLLQYLQCVFHNSERILNCIPSSTEPIGWSTRVSSTNPGIMALLCSIRGAPVLSASRAKAVHQPAPIEGSWSISGVGSSWLATSKRNAFSACSARHTAVEATSKKMNCQASSQRASNTCGLSSASHSESRCFVHISRTSRHARS